MSSKPKKDNDEIKFEDILSSIKVITSADKEKIDPSSESIETFGEESAGQNTKESNDENPEATDNVLLLTDVVSTKSDYEKDRDEEVADDKNKPDSSGELSEEELLFQDQDNELQETIPPSFKIPGLDLPYNITTWSINFQFQPNAENGNENENSGSMGAENLTEEVENTKPLEPQAEILNEEEVAKKEQTKKQNTTIEFDKDETAMERLIREIFIEMLHKMVRDYLGEHLIAAIERIAEKELMKRRQKAQ